MKKNGWDNKPKTNPHLFFLAISRIAITPKISIPNWFIVSNTPVTIHLMGYLDV